MKKVIAILLCFVLFSMCMFTGCAEEVQQTEAPTEGNTSVETTEATVTPEPEESVMITTAETTSPTTEATTVPTTVEATEPTTEEPTIVPTATETIVPTTETIELSVMEEIQRQLEEGNALCAIAFLGSCDGSFSEVQAYLEDSGMVDAYPILEGLSEDLFLETAGSELYLIVQREDVDISVYEQGMDPETGEMLTGDLRAVFIAPAPFLLRCNISDIIPNILLTLGSTRGEKLEYSPFISLRDGSVSVTEGILDLTDYSLIYGDLWEREE